MSQQYEAEMLRQYFFEQGFTYNNYKNLLSNDIMPFDNKYSIWEKETQFENSIMGQYIKKNKVISYDERVVELTNHVDNSISKYITKYPIGCIHASNFNVEIYMDYTKRKYSDILVVKDLYQNLEKIVKFYLSANKGVLLGICKDDGKYYRHAVNYYKNLKFILENTKKNKLIEIDDTIEFDNIKKKIYLLKSE